jgi:hypothetical protein
VSRVIAQDWAAVAWISHSLAKGRLGVTHAILRIAGNR